MNKSKSILCTILAGFMLAINVQPIFAMEESTDQAPTSFCTACLNLLGQAALSGITALSYGSRHAMKGWKTLDKKVPFLTEALVLAFLYKPTKYFINKIIIKKLIPKNMQHIFTGKKKNKRLKKLMIKPRDATISFANPEHFAPGSIDPYVQKLVENIRIKRSGKIEDKTIVDATKIPKLILALGESQIGKTHSLTGLARELGAKKYLLFAATELRNKYFGGTEKNIKLIFKRAKELSSKAHPCVVILDEIDSLVSIKDKKRTANATHTLHDIITSISEGTNGYENVYLMATTNSYADIPSTIQKRFTNDNGTYTHQMPNDIARASILQQHATKMKLKLTSTQMQMLVAISKNKCIPEIKNYINTLHDNLVSAKINASLKGQSLNEFLQLNKDINELMFDQTIVGKLKKCIYAPFVIGKSFINLIVKQFKRAEQLDKVEDEDIEDFEIVDPTKPDAVKKRKFPRGGGHRLGGEQAEIIQEEVPEETTEEVVEIQARLNPAVPAPVANPVPNVANQPQRQLPKRQFLDNIVKKVEEKNDKDEIVIKKRVSSELNLGGIFESVNARSKNRITIHTNENKREATVEIDDGV